MIVDGRILCGACETELPIKEDVFLCRKCMASLPDVLRKAVQQSEEMYQHGARRKALEFLHTDPTDKRINIKPERKQRENWCRCKHPMIARQDGLFGGSENVCINCCRRVRTRRRVLA